MGIIGIIPITQNNIQLTPSRLDVFAFIINSNNFSYEVRSNKILSNVTMINGEFGLNAYKNSDTSGIKIGRAHV